MKKRNSKRHLIQGMQGTLALLKTLALGNQDVESGWVKPVADVVARLHAKRTTE